MNRPIPGSIWKINGESIAVIDVIDAQSNDSEHPVVPLVNFLRIGGSSNGERPDSFMHLSKFVEVAATAEIASPVRQPWAPYLADRADGCKGHYAIARWNPAGYQEVWNLRRNAWGSFSDDVLTLEEANKMLASISFHPMTPSIRSPV